MKYIEVGVNMTKCDFCVKSSPSGQCYWSSQVLREKDCKKAIEQMVKVLGKGTNKKSNSFGRM